jgi:hypothetical protein
MAIKNFPLCTDRLSGLVVMTAPEPKVDPTTGEVKRDRVTGLPIFLVGVSVRKVGSREADVFDVQITSALVGIVEGVTVRLIDLELTPWSMEGRSGQSYKAAGIEVVPTGSAAALEGTAPADGAPAGGAAGGPGRAKTAGGGS